MAKLMGIAQDETGSVTPVVVVGLGLLVSAFMALSSLIQVANAQIQTAAAAEQVALSEAHKLLMGESGCLEVEVPGGYALVSCEAGLREVTVGLSRNLNLGFTRLTISAIGRYLVGA
jgi:hypothetical protein